MINDPACRRAMPELWLCNGTGAQDALLAGHMPEDRTALVEALRYLYLAPKPDAEAAPETPAKPTRLLIVTSFFADETDAHLATLAASAKAGTLDGWEVVVKPHPYLPVVERLKNLYGGAEPALRRGWPHRELPHAGHRGLGFQLHHRGAGGRFPQAAPYWCRPPRTTWTSAPCRASPAWSTSARFPTWPPPSPIPKAPGLPPDYLALDPELPRWKERLGL